MVTAVELAGAVWVCKRRLRNVKKKKKKVDFLF